MEIYRFAFIILLSSLLVSCGEKKQETGNADKAAEKKTPAFTLPEVPVMLQSVEDRLHFVVNHYWDKFDFKDTAYIHAPDITEQAMANYIDLSDTCAASYGGFLRNPHFGERIFRTKDAELFC